MTNSREILKELNQKLRISNTKEKKQTSFSRLVERLGNTVSSIARDITGDYWDATDVSGTGVAKQIGLAINRARINPRHTAKMRFLTKKVHVVQEASDVHQVLVINEDKIHGEDTVRVFGKIFNEGNIFDVPTDSFEWREQRSYFQHYMTTAKSLNHLMTPMHEIANDYVQEISESKGEISDVEDFATRFAMDIIGKTQLGLAIFPAATKSALAHDINASIDKLANPRTLLFPDSLIKYYDTYIHRSKSLEETVESALKMIKETIKVNQLNILTTDNWLRDVSIKYRWCRRRALEFALGLKAGDKSENAVRLAKNQWPTKKAKTDWYEGIEKDQWYKDIVEKEWPLALQTCLSTMKKNTQFTDAAAKDIYDLLHSTEIGKDAALFLVVGHETTARFFQFTMTLLADEKHKKVLEIMVEEIYAYARKHNKKPEEFTKKDIDSLVYMQAILIESLRMFPLVPVLKAEASADFILGKVEKCESKAEHKIAMENRDKKGDVKIKKGDFIFALASVSQRLESNYENPDMFLPERFIETNSDDVAVLKKPDSSKWYPFGIGRRVCLGKQLATQEVGVGLIHMFTKFNLLINEPKRYDNVMIFTLRPTCKVSAKVSEYDRNNESVMMRRR
ncbi:MAG: cytochrome P450 [Gammaproteobacteria bacterium]